MLLPILKSSSTFDCTDMHSDWNL